MNVMQSNFTRLYVVIKTHLGFGNLWMSFGGGNLIYKWEPMPQGNVSFQLTLKEMDVLLLSDHNIEKEGRESGEKLKVEYKKEQEACQRRRDSLAGSLNSSPPSATPSPAPSVDGSSK